MLNTKTQLNIDMSTKVTKTVRQNEEYNFKERSYKNYNAKFHG